MTGFLQRRRMGTPTPTATALPKRPLPEGVFPDIAAAYQSHPETCLSLSWFWLGRHGGVSCPGDLDTCDDCGVTFYLEGLAWVNHDDDSAEEEIRLCGCCAARSGHQPFSTVYGISVQAAPSEAT